MKEKPILFNAEMVRAILAGKKTQTRRVIKPVEHCARFELSEGWPEAGPCWLPTSNSGKVGIFNKYFHRCPYGARYGVLWVRETWRLAAQCTRYYKADGGFTLGSFVDYERASERVKSGAWIPSIHMPRAVCRLELMVAAVRVERVQDITEEDAKAEGVTAEIDLPQYIARYSTAFRRLWDSVNGKPRNDGVDISWAANPWVWVVEFKVGKIKRH